MGTEGQNSPRDVASDNNKHPWEVPPTGNPSPKKGEENHIEQKEKRKKWVKSHRVLLLIIALIVVVLVGVGIFIFFKLNEEKAPEDEDNLEDVALIMYGFPEDFSIDDAITSAHAFSYALGPVRDIALEGVNQLYPNVALIEDNMDAYIKSLKDDNEKTYFRLFTIFLVASYGDAERAEYLLENFDAENRQLNKHQRYAYLRAYAAYYMTAGNSEKSAEYYETLRKEFAEDDAVLVNEKTGEVIKDENFVKEMVDNFKNGGEGGEK